MKHIIITNQNSNVEIVDSNIIHKLAEEAQDCDASSNMTGNLQTTKTYKRDVDFLTAKFPGLTINVTGDYYKSFVDPAANEFFAKCPAGDGEGILETEFAKLSNVWGGVDQKYRVDNNNNYFGESAETDESNIPLAPIIKKIVYFPEIVDFPVDNSGITFGGWYLPIFRFMNSLKEARCPRQASYIVFEFRGNGSNVELLDMSDADNYIGTDLNCDDGNNFPKLKKIVLAPSVTYIKHGCLNMCGSPEGMDIFAYTTDLSTVPSNPSTWVLQNLPHTATLWVQDSVYNDWLQHKQIVNNNYVVVKKFSEYTGNDLVQKWLEPSND